MRTLSTLLLILLYAPLVLSQSNEDYYHPSTRPAKSGDETAVPPVNTFKTQRTKTAADQISNIRIRNRLYFGIDGFMRTDRSSISNTFNGLIATRTGAKSGYSASVGWINQEKWAFEIAYSRSPIHNILIINGDYPMEYKMENDKNNLDLSIKRRLLFGRSNSSLRKSAFWIGAGAGIVPNSGAQKEYLQFEGYARQGRRPVLDTLFLTTDTHTSTKLTGFTYLTAEYVLKVAKAVDLSFYARKQWGLGTSLMTDMAYFVNKVQTQQSTIRADGTGLAFGISLRYIFAIGLHDGHPDSSE